MKNIKKLLRHSLYILLAIVLLSCDSDEKRRNNLDTKANLMIDQKGNYWIIKHHLGSLHTVEYLGDSTIYNRYVVGR